MTPREEKASHGSVLGIPGQRKENSIHGGTSGAAVLSFFFFRFATIFLHYGYAEYVGK